MIILTDCVVRYHSKENVRFQYLPSIFFSECGLYQMDFVVSRCFFMRIFTFAKTGQLTFDQLSYPHLFIAIYSVLLIPLQ